MTVVFVGLAWFSGRQVWRQVELNSSLISATGTVLSATVAAEGATFMNTQTGAVSTIVYWPVITYEYEVGGVKYQGDRYGATARRYGNREAAVRILESYRPGNSVTVWYDPDSPAFAVLTTRWSVFLSLALFVAACSGTTYTSFRIWQSLKA